MPLYTRTSLLVLTTALALGGCGGSSSDTNTSSSSATPAAITISGKAASASALLNRRVRALCRTGSAEADTDSSTGRYQLNVSGGVFPCALRVQATDTQALHSVATDAGTGSATANITPLTELTVAQLTSSSPATYFDSGFAASSGNAVTSAAVATAATQVIATLASGGVDASAAGNPVTSTLVAPGGGTTDSHGQALVALNTALQTSGTTLPALVQTVAQTSQSTGTPATSTPSLPAAQQLQARAPNCSALRSGRYRVVFNGKTSPGIITINAASLVGTSADGSTFTLTANGTCRYRTPSGGELVVSAAGVITGQADESPFIGIVMFPEQTHDLSAVAGTLDFLGLDGVGSAARPQLVSMTATVSASGEVTAITFCDKMLTGCTSRVKGDAGFPVITIVPNAAGGFILRNTTDGFEDPMYVYKSGSGANMYVLGSAGGHMALGTRNVARTLPTAGAVSESWNLSFVPSATEPLYSAPGSVGRSKNTVVSINANAVSYVREAVVDFSTGVTVPETVELNVPRPGYVRRVPGTATASDGSSRNVSEWLALSLRGTGLTAVGIVGNQNLVLSTTQVE